MYTPEAMPIEFRKNLLSPLVRVPLKMSRTFLPVISYSEISALIGLTDSTATVLYSGSIDNWAFAAGKMRIEATEFFLTDALENIVSGKPVALKKTEAYGCIIE